MSKLTIFDWSGKRREVDFAGYNRDHTACLIRDERGRRRAITLHLPRSCGIRFYKNPIGPENSPPCEINRVALHLPACFSSKEEKQV